MNKAVTAVSFNYFIFIIFSSAVILLASSKLVYVSLNLDVYSLKAVLIELDLKSSAFRVMHRKHCAFGLLKIS